MVIEGANPFGNGRMSEEPCCIHHFLNKSKKYTKLLDYLDDRSPIECVVMPKCGRD